MYNQRAPGLLVLASRGEDRVGTAFATFLAAAQAWQRTELTERESDRHLSRGVSQR